MKPITDQDVARLLEGEIQDPREAQRILNAIESNPHLAAMADLLSDTGDEDDDFDIDHSQFDLSQLSDLRHTRLARLCSPPAWEQLSDGISVITDVEYRHDLRVETFQLRLTRQGNSLQLVADWPTGLRPTGFLLTQFDLVKGRVYPNTDRTLSYSTSVTVPDRRPSLATESTKAGREQTRVLNPIGEPLHAAAEGIEAEARERDPATDVSTSRYFFARCNARNEIELTTEIPEGQDGDIVMAELAYPGKASPVRHAVQLEAPRFGRLATTHVKDFPWPNDVPRCEGTLTIRPLRNEDLPLLNNDQVSALLAREDSFAAIPITADESGQLSSEFRYPSERAAAGDAKTTWFLRMVEEGGAA